MWHKIRGIREKIASLRLRTKAVVSSVLLSLFISALFAFLSMLSVRSVIIEQVDAQSRTDFSMQMSKAQNALGSDAFDESSTSSAGQHIVNELVARLQNEGSSELVSVYLSAGNNLSQIVPVSTDPSYIRFISSDFASRVRTSASERVFSQAINLGSGRDATKPGRVYGTSLVLDNDEIFTLYCFYSYQQNQDFLTHIQVNLLILCIAVSILIGIIVFRITTRIITPVQQAAAVAESLALGNLDKRLDITAQDEIGVLQRSLNDMAESLVGKITQLETMTKMQKQFVSDVSHELRTPTTTIRMAADRLMRIRDQFDPSTQRTVVLLHNQIIRFQSLLLDLLEISRNDAGKSQLDSADVNLYDVVSDVIAQLMPLASENKTRVEAQMRDENVILYGDSMRLSRIFKNILSNAIDFSANSRVAVDMAQNQKYVVLSVRDWGIGIDVEDLPHIFDRFWRKDASRSRLTGGTGLGLSICLDDVKLHHGEIYVRSQLGEGTWFLIALPRDWREVIDVNTADLPLFFTDEGNGCIVSASRSENHEVRMRASEGISHTIDSGAV